MLRNTLTTTGFLVTAVVCSCLVMDSLQSAAPPPPPQCGDVNGDGVLDVSDAITLLGHLFASGPAPVCASGGPTPAVKLGSMTPLTVDAYEAFSWPLEYFDPCDLHIEDTAEVAVTPGVWQVNVRRHRDFSGALTVHLDGERVATLHGGNGGTLIRVETPGVVTLHNGSPGNNITLVPWVNYIDPHEDLYDVLEFSLVRLGD